MMMKTLELSLVAHHLRKTLELDGELEASQIMVHHRYL
jgi:hypothetical protein